MPAQPTRLRIRTLAHGGEGVGRAVDDTGPTWFVPGTLPGEEVEAEPVHQSKRWIRGRLRAVVHPAAERVQPPCSLAEVCGGCSWQHIATGTQGRLKRTIVVDQLRGVVPDDRVVLAYEGSATAYRRRVRMHWKQDEHGFALGFYASGSREIVDVRHCPVVVPALDKGLQRLREVAAVLPAQGEVLGLTDGQRVVLGLPGVRPVPEVLAALEAIVHDPIMGIELRGGRKTGRVGRPTLEIDGADGLPPLRTSPFVFTQAQAAGSRALVRHVARRAAAQDLRVLELYAGAGNFTRALARSAARVWASDTDHEAVELLRGLATAHHLPINAKRQSAPRLLAKLAESNTKYDVIVLDPPRAGLGQEAMVAACKVATSRIVYVSCDPATSRRDLEAARSHGFEVAEVAVLDLMPMTPEIELVATLVPRSTWTGT